MTLLNRIPQANTILRMIKDPLYKNAGYILGITIANSATGFVFWLIAARLYTPEEVGISSSIISIVALLAGIAGMGLGIGITRFLGTSEDPGILINSSITLSVLTSVAISLVYIAGINLWSPSLASISNTLTFGAALFLFVLITNLGNLTQWIFIGSRRAGFAFAQSVIMNIARLALVALLGKISWGIALSAALGWGISLFVAIIFFLPKIIKIRLWPLVSKASVVQLVPYSAGNYFADFLYFAPALIAPPMMLEIFGASASAYTYIVLMVGNFLISPGISLSKSAFAEASSEQGSKQRIMRKSFIGGALVTIPISILVFLFSEFILVFFGTAYADEAGLFLRIIALAAPFVVILNSYFYVLKVENQLVELIALCLFIFSFTLISTTLFAEKYGYSSYGLGWLLSQVLAIIFIFVKRKIGQRKSIPENL